MRVLDDAYEIVDGMGFPEKPPRPPFSGLPILRARQDQRRILTAADRLIDLVRRPDCPIGAHLYLLRALGEA